MLGIAHRSTRAKPRGGGEKGTGSGYDRFAERDGRRGAIVGGKDGMPGDRAWDDGFSRPGVGRLRGRRRVSPCWDTGLSGVGCRAIRGGMPGCPRWDAGLSGVGYRAIRGGIPGYPGWDTGLSGMGYRAIRDGIPGYPGWDTGLSGMGYRAIRGWILGYPTACDPALRWKWQWLRADDSGGPMGGVPIIFRIIQDLASPFAFFWVEKRLMPTIVGIGTPCNNPCRPRWKTPPW